MSEERTWELPDVEGSAREQDPSVLPPMHINNEIFAKPKSGKYRIGTRKYESPEKLFQDCIEYIQWCENNPLYEVKAFSHQGDVTLQNIPRMRAMTIPGLCLFLGVHRTLWATWRREREDLRGVIDAIDECIRNQKFIGASAGFLNPVIIARDLGLKDNINHEHSGPGGGPIETTTKLDFTKLSSATMAELLDAMDQKKEEERNSLSEWEE